MRLVFIVLIIAFSGILIGWIGYSTITDNIIREQSREIARLKAELRKHDIRG